MTDTPTYRDTFPHWADGFDRLIPPHMRGAVERYILHGITPGSFLTAVLQNDMQGAMMRADDMNKTRLHDYAAFLYDYAPSRCHGSFDRISEWIGKGGYFGVDETADASVQP